MLSISNKNTVLSILDTLLGHHTRKKNDNYAYHCPMCHHPKQKLEIDVDSQSYHCWVCDFKGLTIKTLLNKLNAESNQKKSIRDIYGGHNYKKDTRNEKILLKLPPEFKTLTTPLKDPDYANAIYYCKRRGISLNDTYKYNIGYCDTGKYSSRIIIPSYDENGLLNFFVGRDYTDNSELPYVNPMVDRNIIGNDIHINWSEPINIVEGQMDALAVKINAIPLFGKFLSQKLKDKIRLNNVKEIRIILDPDAIKHALIMAEYFMNEGINVKMVLGSDDPSQLGFTEITKLINTSHIMEYSDLVRLKLKM